jgi:hypothetical protein
VAKSSIPDPLERRHLIERDLDPAQALRIAEAYLAEDRGLEAVAFLGKAKAGPRLRALREQAVACGDAFLLREAAQAEGGPPTAAEWRALAEAAAGAEKELYAAEARRQAGLGDL